MRRLILLLMCCASVWAGCAPPPTPFPAAIIPTPSLSPPQHIVPAPPFDRAIVLLLNTRHPPLDDPAILTLVSAAIDPVTFALTLAQDDGQPIDNGSTRLDPLTVRTELANLGYPDGLPLDMDGDVPGIDLFATLLRPYGLDIRLTRQDADTTHLLWRAERADQPASAVDGQIRIPVVLLPAQTAPGAP